MTYRAAGIFSSFKKAFICLLSAVLVVGLMPAICTSQAYADTTITSVEVLYDENAVVLNSAMTGNEANELFKANRSLSEDTQAMCKLDYMYSFVAEKADIGSKGQILRKRLAGSDELLTPGKQYYLVYNLIQKQGYQFPSNSTDARLPVSVKVNGKTVSGVQVDRYNTDSVDVYVPIAFDSRPVVTALAIDPAEISMKQGSTRQLEAKIKGSQDVGLQWSLSGNKVSGTSIDSNGNVTIASSQPAGTVLTATATTVGVSPAVSATCQITVIDQNPSITSITAEPQNPTVDVRGGTQSVPISVIMQGTADHEYDAELTGARSTGTQITDLTRDGFTLVVSANEPSGVLRILLTSKVSAKTSLMTITVQGTPRVNQVELAVDATNLYRDTSVTQRGADINSFMNFDHVKSLRGDTYVDFTKHSQGYNLYTYLAKRTDGGYSSSNKWEQSDFARVQDDELLSAGTEYYLKLNIDNYERSGNKSLWPVDLSDIKVTVNGISIGDGYGYVDWYSQTETGSIIVYVPLGERSSVNYSIEQFAPGMKLITVTGEGEPGFSGALKRFWNILTFGETWMMYDYSKKVWYGVVSDSVEALKVIDFTKTQTPMNQPWEYWGYEINGYESNTYEAVGDVNGTGRINVVDAQIIYDVACGKYTIEGLHTRISNGDRGLIGQKAALFCDVTGDNYVDASDARVTQYYALHGTWPKG